MKKDGRTSRYYDLNDSKPFVTSSANVYASSNNLAGWWNFRENSIPNTSSPENKKPNSLFSGDFVTDLGAEIKIHPTSVETPAFLEGTHNLRNASFSIKDGQVFRLTSPSFKAAKVDNTFSFSMTFKIVHSVNPGLPHGRDVTIELAQWRCQESDPFTLVYDHDGAGGAVPRPSIGLVVMTKDGLVKRWNADLVKIFGSPQAAHAAARDWMRVDFIVDDAQAAIRSDAKFIKDVTGAGGGARIYVNGVEAISVPASTTSWAGKQINNVYNQIWVGAISNTHPVVPHARRSIQLGECALWSSTLTTHEVEELFEKTVSSRNSGIISNPPSYTLDCLETHDSYPTIDRPGDQRRQGRNPVSFNDSGVPSAPLVGTKINYPTLYHPTEAVRKATGTLVATPNTVPTLTGSVTADSQRGVSNVIGGYTLCDKPESSDGFQPFNDALQDVALATYDGFLHRQLPGFSNRISNRIIIDIDISATTPKILKVITGSQGHPSIPDGQTHGIPATTLPSDEYTGLAYYNFARKEWESIGGRNSETGQRIIWNLPGETSSSEVFERESYDSSELNRNNGKGTVAEQGVRDLTAWDRSRSPFIQLDDFEKVPRIFQPYTSMTSHRTTFNHVHAYEGHYNSFEFYAEMKFYRTASSDLATFMPQGAPVRSWLQGFKPKLDLAADWGVFSMGFPANARTETFAKPFLQPNGGGYGGSNAENFVWSRWSTDKMGYGIDGTYRDIVPIWNDEGEVNRARIKGSGNTLTRQFDSTFSTMGRPVAYTNWCRSSMFHASSSQLIKMSDYINTPFLLEAMQVGVEVDATRLHNPHATIARTRQSADPNHANWQDRDMVLQWSNTNNQIDNLTFFLLRQEQTENINTATKAQVAEGTIRELVTFSNNIFSSPFVGWDSYDMYYRHLVPAEVPTPMMAGARTARVFKVEPLAIEENVPGVDSITFYSNSNGTAINAFGTRDGLFMTSRNALNGHDIIGHPNVEDVNPLNNPAISRTIIAKHRIDAIAPVRKANAYAQHTTPILPVIAGQPRGGLHHHYSGRRNTSGHRDNYFAGTGSYIGKYVGAPQNTWASNIFYFFRGGQIELGPASYTDNVNTTNPNPQPVDHLGNPTQPYVWSSEPVVPREALACMGTYWPGGAKTATTKRRVPTTFEYHSASLHHIPATELDSWTHPLSILPLVPPVTGVANRFPAGAPFGPFYDDYDIGTIVEQTFAQTAEVSTRHIRSDTGASVQDRKEVLRIGEDLKANPDSRIRKGQGYTPASLKKAFLHLPYDGFTYPPAIYGNAVTAAPANQLNDFANFAPPYYHNVEISGSASEESGYVLLPSDELVLGVQWSPGDPVWRSHSAVEKASEFLSFTRVPVATGGGGHINPSSGSQNVPAPFDSYRAAMAGSDLGEWGNLHLQIDPAEVGRQAYRHAGYCKSNDLMTYASASCTISSSPAVLRLFGTLLQNQTQKYHSLPQQLTTTAVHEVIGSEPVLDQFDLVDLDNAKRLRMSQFVSGTVINGAEVEGYPSPWKDILSESLSRGVRRSLKKQNLHDVGQVSKTIRLTDTSEYYYDSIPPNIPQMFAVDGMTRQRFTDLIGADKDQTSTVSPRGSQLAGPWHFRRSLFAIRETTFVQGQKTIQDTVNSGGTLYEINRKFGRSFPFEPRYASCQRSFFDRSKAGYARSSDGTNESNKPLIYSAAMDGYVMAAAPQYPGGGSLTAGLGVTSGWTADRRDWEIRVAASGSNSMLRNYDARDGMHHTVTFPIEVNNYVLEPKILAVERTSPYAITPWHSTNTNTDFAFETMFKTQRPTGRTDRVKLNSAFMQIGRRGSTQAFASEVSASVDIANRNMNDSGRTAFFGVGDARHGLLDTSFYYISYKTQDNSGFSGVVPTALTGSARPVDACHVVCRKPRGYRYGLCAAEPKKLTAVFRRDRYGQFRDMLEQRDYSALYIRDPGDVASERRLQGLRARRTTTEFPVLARFRTPVFRDPQFFGADVKVSPNETNCSNLNVFASSSLPFFDGELKNRDAAPATEETVIIS